MNNKNDLEIVENYATLLMSTVLGIAREKINTQESFFPFSGVTKYNGKISILDTVQIDAEIAKKTLIVQCQNLAFKNEICAAAICVDSQVIITGESVPINAIHLILETKYATPMHGFQFYEKQPSGQYLFTQLEVQKEKSIIFL